MDTIGTKIFVLISEVSLFQGKNTVFIEVGTRSSVLIGAFQNHAPSIKFSPSILIYLP